MKLSMWMIANRLEALEPEVQIKDSARAVLRSARRVYATNCVHVYQDGPDVICAGEGDYIRLRNMEEKQVFEIVQSVFDFYDNWNEELHQALAEENFEQLIEKCWQVFHNPIILLDANRKVIAMSAQYSENELDDEWKHLCEFGYSSVNSIQYLQRFYDSTHLSDGTEPKMYRFPKEAGRKDCLFSPVFYKGILYGKLSVLEENRPVNAGDVEMMRYVVRLLGPLMARITLKDENPMGHSVFLDMIQGRAVDARSARRQMDYLGWEEDHVFRVLTFAFQDQSCKDDMLFLAASLIANYLGRTGVCTNKSHVVAILDEDILPRSRALSRIHTMMEKNGLEMGESFCAKGIRSLPYLYHQSLAALEFGKKFHGGGLAPCYRYYDYAVDHILEKNGMMEGAAELLYACHPDILRFWKQDEQTGGSKIDTLWAYLNNDRSLINTAQELYVHRSTLVYRIKKITDELTCDITDSYTRDYMKISIRLLRIYRGQSADIGETHI